MYFVLGLCIMLAGLLLLAQDGRLPEYLVGAASGSLLVLGLSVLVANS